jgi:chemosensory pili system protein ChpA (sensor histidine kinase/response regulator)
MGNEFDREQLVSIFVAEAADDMATLRAVLHPVDGADPSPTDVQGHHTIGHKLKGAALLYGFPGLGQLGGLLETLLEDAVAMSGDRWSLTVDLLREIVERFTTRIEAVRQGGTDDGQSATDLVRRANELRPEPAADAGGAPSTLSDTDVMPELDEEVLSYFIPEVEEYLNTIDTLLLRLQGNFKDPEIIHHLFRVAHTLKGSAYTVGFQVIGDVAHPIETCMSAAREGRTQVTAGWIPCLQQAMQLIRTLIRRDASQMESVKHQLATILPAVRRLESEIGDTPVQDSAVAENSSQAGETAEPTPTGTDPDRAAAGSERGGPDLSDEYLVPDLDAEVLSYFAPEAQEYLETLEALLLRLENESHNPDIIHQLFRTAHTLKGSAYTVGFQSIGDLTHHIEDFMGAVREGRLKVLPGHTDLLLRSIDVIRTLMRRDPSNLSRLKERFSTSLKELKRLEDMPEALSAEPAIPAVTDAGPEEAAAPPPAAADVAQGADNKSPEDREVIRVSRERLERLLNLVGELVIDRGRLEQRLRVLERLSQQVLANKMRLIDAVRSFEDKHTFSFQPMPGAPVSTPSPSLPGLSDFGSLEFDKYDDFNILARRISEVTADIAESMSQLSGSIRRAQDDMGQLQQLTLGMRDEIARARMVPIGTPFTRFRRAAREMARATGKDVNLVTSGEHTEIDTGVVERLVDPLVHLVRNAVYHGIEPTAVRRAHGKPATGTVYLHAAHRGNSVTIEVEDDGAGLDLQRIKAKAVRLGLLRPEVAETLPETEIVKFIFVPGFSTAESVGDQAGRGVGLDVVKRVIETMNGHIEVESVRGQGTKFTLHLPLTLLIATALLVRVQNERYAIPLPSVREVTMPSATALQRMGDRTILQIGDEAIEVHPLSQLLRRSTGAVEQATPIVIVKTPTGPLGCAVDELLGRQEIVIKSLGALKPFERSVFGGATIDPEGRIILVLDISRLTTREYHEALPLSGLGSVATDREGPSEPAASAEGQPRHTPLLLIDDSLSIRKFVGRMLESAGYAVETAVDGEEGLRKASAQDYRLIITDLEMPKLNGFEVIQALRGRPRTQQTPILVMTTRAGEKHRQMAINIGASGYIAKPVEERALIQEIQRWLGNETAVRK